MNYSHEDTLMRLINYLLGRTMVEYMARPKAADHWPDAGGYHEFVP